MLASGIRHPSSHPDAARASATASSSTFGDTFSAVPSSGANTATLYSSNSRGVDATRRVRPGTRRAGRVAGGRRRRDGHAPPSRRPSRGCAPRGRPAPATPGDTGQVAARKRHDKETGWHQGVEFRLHAGEGPPAHQTSWRFSRMVPTSVERCGTRPGSRARTSARYVANAAALRGGRVGYGEEMTAQILPGALRRRRRTEGRVEHAVGAQAAQVPLGWRVPARGRAQRAAAPPRDRPRSRPPACGRGAGGRCPPRRAAPARPLTGTRRPRPRRVPRAGRRSSSREDRNAPTAARPAPRHQPPRGFGAGAPSRGAPRNRVRGQRLAVGGHEFDPRSEMAGEGVHGPGRHRDVHPETLPDECRGRQKIPAAGDDMRGDLTGGGVQRHERTAQRAGQFAQQVRHAFLPQGRASRVGPRPPVRRAAPRAGASPRRAPRRARRRN